MIEGPLVAEAFAHAVGFDGAVVQAAAALEEFLAEFPEAAGPAPAR